MGKLQPYLLWVFRVVVLLYTLIAGYFFLNRPAGIGDEDLFISDLKYIQSDGWWAAIEKGISLPYMLLSYLPAQFLDTHIALRFINIVLLLGLAGYFFYFRSINKADFYLLLLFFISTVGYFYTGINDTLLIVSSVIFFSETYRLAFIAKKGTLALWGTALIIMFFTRSLTLIFLPVIVISIFLVIKKGAFSKKTLLIPVLFFLTMIALNLPALQTNGGLSFDKKDPPQDVTVNWVQRQYLAQLMVNDGSLKNHKHPSWEQTMEYLDVHGEEALPKGILSGLFFDIGLTVKEFFKDLGEILLYGSRQIGLILPIMLFFGIQSLIKRKRIDRSTYIPLLLIMMMCIFALIIISYVELRWFGSVFIMTIYGFWMLAEEERIPKLLVTLNYAAMTLLSCYGIYGILKVI